LLVGLETGICGEVHLTLPTVCSFDRHHNCVLRKLTRSVWSSASECWIFILVVQPDWNDLNSQRFNSECKMHNCRFYFLVVTVSSSLLDDLIYGDQLRMEILSLSEFLARA
jgi:hypothetical protein